MVRAIVRAAFTRERLLEWETAAEAELSTRRGPADTYLNWIPPRTSRRRWARVVASARIFLRRAPDPGALGIQQAGFDWLNRSTEAPRKELPGKELAFVRRCALFTWRYFAQYCTEEHHWLIPDNVQEEPPAVAARVSPTNLGLLLNAQQVACELGYLTVPEMSVQTQRTLGTVSRIPKLRGHLLNWYNTHTLEPLMPRFVSSVDSGNLVASLWTLQQGLLARLKQPLIQRSLALGVLDHLRALAELKGVTKRQLSRCEQALETKDWLPALLALCEDEMVTQPMSMKSGKEEEVQWFQEQLRSPADRSPKVGSFVRSLGIAGICVGTERHQDRT